MKASAAHGDDVAAATDMNVVMTGDGRFIEVQGTAEEEPFNRSELDELLDLAEVGCTRLTGLQVAALSLPLPERSRLLDGTPAVRA